MPGFVKPSTIIVLLCSGLIHGCALTAATEPDIQSQRDALTRWTHCIERSVARSEASAKGVFRHANDYCEGHQRDVLATFPEHQENQVAQLLSQRARVLAAQQMVRTGTNNAWAEYQDVYFENFNPRLTEARSDDL